MEMLLIFLDSETTGVNPEKHRLVDIAFKIMDTTSGKIITSYESIVSQPKEIWAQADAESVNFTGFTFEELLKGKSEKVVASEIINDLNHSGIGAKTGAFLCQNPSFDRIFFNQLIPVNLQERYGWPYHWLDLASMYLMLRYLQNNKSLKEIKEEGLSKDKIAEFLGLPPEKRPHRAMNGVNHLISCFEGMFHQAKHGEGGVGL